MQLLSFAVLFLVVALVAGLLGFSGVAHASSGIARILFGVFIVLFILALVMGY